MFWLETLQTSALYFVHQSQEPGRTNPYSRTARMRESSTSSGAGWCSDRTFAGSSPGGPFFNWAYGVEPSDPGKTWRLEKTLEQADLSSAQGRTLQKLRTITGRSLPIPQTSLAAHCSVMVLPSTSTTVWWRRALKHPGLHWERLPTPYATHIA